MTRYPMKTLLACVAAAAVVSVAGPAMAVPYASSVTSDGGTGFNFILNEPADLVTVTRDGANPVTFPAAAAGTHNFDMNTFSTYEITVTHSAAAGWAESSTSLNNPFLDFQRPQSIAINKNPASSNFGRVYIANAQALPTATGRSGGDGVYILNADATDIDGKALNDTSAARTGGGLFSAGWNLTSNGPWRMTVGADDTLFIADWGDQTGGVKTMSPDGTSGAFLLDGDNGFQPLPVGQNHGSVVSMPITTGTLGTDLVLYTIDEDLEASVVGTGNHIWRYDLGTTTSNYTGAPTLVLDASTEGVNSDGSVILFDLNIGVDANLQRDPHTGNFIITQARNDGNETGILIMDSTFTTVLFNSKQFSLDNSLDGAVDDLAFPEWDLIQDIFRYVTTVEVSPDGSTLALHRRQNATELDVGAVGGNNPFLGTADVLLVPLDASGVPILDISDPIGNPLLGTTPLDMTVNHGSARKALTWDAAGNLYAGSSSATIPDPSGFIGDEQVVIWGPGGDTVAVTRSDGTFELNPSAGGLLGDYNDDGFVGIEDLNLVLQNWNATVTAGNKLLGDGTGDGFVGIEDLNEILGNWNAGTPPPPGSVVPEPTTLALLGLGGMAMLRRRR